MARRDTDLGPGLLGADRDSTEQLIDLTASSRGRDWLALETPLRRPAWTQLGSVTSEAGQAPDLGLVGPNSAAGAPTAMQKLLAVIGVLVVLFVLGSTAYFAFRYLR